MERLTISISTEQRQFLKDAVARGDYATESEVVRDLIRQRAVASVNAELLRGLQGEGVEVTRDEMASIWNEARARVKAAARKSA